ncbi:hypothetical protein HCUR_00503 [Holospora curviuscula]|uniref:Insertion element IS402-like domain-containing protein n=1 Tax=Holospora curviuscula TaxID=1082868 RepID=A0A2S5R9H1_9PROT|nr:hypothetical protein HCUR_00503 [Holospora curviuscula]
MNQCKVGAHRRHDMPDRIWSLLEPRLPGRKGFWGSIAHDNRLFINAVFWILRTGAPWRDLPPDLWPLEKHALALLQMAGQRRLERSVRIACDGA